MPNTTTSEQIGTLTSTSDGVNVVPKLIAKSHFFAEGNSLSQQASQAFGAISATQFRTSAKVNITGKIYTICQGQIFVQPQANNPSKVNVILRPFKEPIQGLSIKYFIYRGLNKSEFIAGNTVAAEGTTGFIDFIWNEFNKFYADDTDPIPQFLGKYIGFPENLANQSSTDLIDKYFFKIAEIINPTTGEENPKFAYELPLIPRGVELGNASGEIGIDIVLNSGDYSLENDTNPFKLDLAFARKSEVIIDTALESNLFKKKLLKEATVRFMDIAAFYGMHANGAGQLFFDSSTSPLTTKTDIYNKMNGFATKHNLYLYIQSNRQRSYNFYKNYDLSETDPNNIKIGVTENSLATITFGTDGWPIHVFNEIQDTTLPEGTLCLQLVTDNSESTSVNVQRGFLMTPHVQNFVEGENLLQPIVEDPLIPAPQFTKPILFSSPSVDVNIISSLIQVIYEGKGLIAEECVDPPFEPREFEIKDIDDLFGPVNATASNTQENATQLPVIVGNELQIISFPLESGENNIGVVRVKRVEDLLQTTDNTSSIRRVTYETLLDSIGGNGSSLPNNSSNSIDSTSGQAQQYSIEENNFYQPAPPYLLKTELFTNNTNVLTGLQLITQEGNRPTKKILGITREEHNKLGVPVATHSLNNAKIYFENTITSGNGEQTSSEGITFKKYKLFVIAEHTDGSLKIYIPDDEVTVYTTDDYVFFSKKYSEYVPEISIDGDDMNITLIEIDLT